MFALWYSLNYIPIKYRGSVKKTSHLRPVYLSFTWLQASMVPKLGICDSSEPKTWLQVLKHVTTTPPHITLVEFPSYFVSPIHDVKKDNITFLSTLRLNSPTFWPPKKLGFSYMLERWLTHGSFDKLFPRLLTKAQNNESWPLGSAIPISDILDIPNFVPSSLFHC
jgi:hypothetical protein